MVAGDVDCVPISQISQYLWGRRKWDNIMRAKAGSVADKYVNSGQRMKKDHSRMAFRWDHTIILASRKPSDGYRNDALLNSKENTFKPRDR